MVWWEVEFDFVVAEAADGDGGIGHGEIAEPFHAAGLLGCWGAEEFSAGGGVEEEVADFDHCSDGAAGGDGVLVLIAGGVDFSAFVVIFGSGLDGEARDRGDGSEGLASETHGGDLVEVVGFGDFAGGVGGEGELDLVGGDAAAVVGDADEFDAALLEFDGDLGCAGVDGVFDEFFED